MARRKVSDLSVEDVVLPDPGLEVRLEVFKRQSEHWTPARRKEAEEQLAAATAESAHVPKSAAEQQQDLEIAKRAAAIHEELKRADESAWPVLEQLEKTRPQGVPFPERPAALPAGTMWPDSQTREWVAEFAGSIGIAFVVGRMTEELGRDVVAAMQPEEFKRNVAHWMATRLDVPDREGFLASLERAFGLAPLPLGARLPFKPGPGPLAFAEGSADIVASITFKAVAATAWRDAGAPGALHRDPAGNWHFAYSDPSGEEVNVSFRDVLGVAGLVPSDWLARQFKEFGDGDLDTLLVVLARLSQFSDEHGGVWVAAADILSERGIQKKTKREAGKKYAAGHRAEDLRTVAEQMERLGTVWVEILRSPAAAEVSVRGRPRKDVINKLEDRLFHLGPRWSQEELLGGQSKAIAWYVREGLVFSRFREGAGQQQLAPIARKVLAYHQYHERWKKRLGLYFTINMRLADERLGSRVRVGDLLEAVGLTFEGQGGGGSKRSATGLRNPQRSWKKLRAALDGLQADGVIGPYRFVGLPEPLPAKNWADLVLASTLEVEAPTGQATGWERLLPNGRAPRQLAEGR